MPARRRPDSSVQPDLFREAEARQARTRAERKLKHFARMAAQVDELFQAALATKGPAAFNAYLDAVCRLRHLSAFNAMLVHAQRPGVSWVATRRQWRRKGRIVLPGAIPILILQPFGPVLFMYEATDTDPPLDSDRDNTLLAFGDPSEEQWKRLCWKAGTMGVRVEITPFGSRLAGTAQGMGRVPQRHNSNEYFWIARINSKFDLPTRIATLAHELGHIYCGHCGADPRGRWPARRPDACEIRELEAEAVAWLVCHRMGIRTRSPEYLSQLATPANIGEVSKDLGMFSIIRAVEHIESTALENGNLEPSIISAHASI